MSDCWDDDIDLTAAVAALALHHRDPAHTYVHAYKQSHSCLYCSFRPLDSTARPPTRGGGLAVECNIRCWRVFKQEIRSMERVSAQCCCIQYTVIEIFDCSCNDLELGRFKIIQGRGHCPNRKPVVGFLSDLLWVQHRTSHHFRDIWH